MDRTFDYLVIGAQKSGTTSLWRSLEGHPQVRVPSDKERPFFEVDERYERGLEDYVGSTFADPDDEQRIGIVSPQLMPGNLRELDKIVGRIAATCPEVKLVAILRDPIERAVSYFRWVKRREGASGEDLLAFTAQRARRHGGLGGIPFVRAGDYGWILRHYLEVFPPEQLLVLYTDDLEHRPAELFRSLFEFLGVDPTHDAGTPRLNVGGQGLRVGREALDELAAELSRSVWPLVDDDNVRRGFLWWLRQIWNTNPEPSEVEVPEALQAPLAERYLRDAEILSELLGTDPPWIGRLRADRNGHGPATPELHPLRDATQT